LVVAGKPKAGNGEVERLKNEEFEEEDV